MERRALLLTGTVGVGKTTIAIAVAQRLAERGDSSGCIDMDVFSRMWPPPEGDPFRKDLALANLRSTAPNFWKAGVGYLTIAWVVENRQQVAAVADCVGAPLTVVRLTAPLDVVEERLRVRHTLIKTAELQWHLRRSVELDAVLERCDVQWSRVQNEGTPAETASLVLEAVHWTPE